MEQAVLHKSGPASDRAFVFFHGCPGSAADWTDVTSGKADRSIVLVDLPDSTGARESELDAFELEQVAVRAVESLEASRLVLVGISYGGWLIARLASRFASRIKRCVSVSGFDRIAPESAAFRKDMVRSIEAGKLNAQALASTVLPLFLGSSEVPSSARDTLEARLHQITTAQWMRHLQRAIQLGEDAAAVLPFETPITCLHGRHDPLTPFADSEALASRSSRGHVIAVDTDAHLLPVTHSDIVARWVFEDVD